MKIFTKGLPKKLKDFAHKRQVKHVSTILEPSIPFHTLEDDTNKREFEHEYHIMVTQSGDPNNKSKPAYKKYCSYCHKNNHGILNYYQKQRDGKYQKYKN